MALLDGQQKHSSLNLVNYIKRSLIFDALSIRNQPLRGHQEVNYLFFFLLNLQLLDLFRGDKKIKNMSSIFYAFLYKQLLLLLSFFIFFRTNKTLLYNNTEKENFEKKKKKD